MPDPIRIASAVLAAAATAIVIVAISARVGRGPLARRLNIGWLLGCAAGFYLGIRILGLWPHWPLREDQDRLLLVVLPAVIAVEFLAGTTGLPRGAAILLRLTVAGGAGRLLLAGSTHLQADGSAAGPLKLAPWQLLLVMGVTPAVVWLGLAALGRRAADAWLPGCLAIACGGAALALMLSGYLSGGQLGLPFAAALAGSSLYALRLPKPLEVAGPLGLGTVMLFSLVVIGHFFGELNLAHAALLLAAPLLAWLPELWPRAKLHPALSGAMRVILVTAAVGWVVFDARRVFIEHSRPPGNPDSGAAVDDYMNYGR